MLLRFGVANHASIRDYQELSLVASAAIKDSETNLLSSPAVPQKILPAVLIYGANASGKTSVHDALQLMRAHVVNSFAGTKPGAPIPRVPFALDAYSKTAPSRFDCDFIVGGVRCHYGFTLDDTRFLEEWLYAFPEGHKRTLFFRSVDNPHIEFGKSLRGRNRSIEAFTRPNSLFLSASAQNAHAQLSPIYEYFETGLAAVGMAIDQSGIQPGGDTIDPRVVDFLRLADTGIMDVRFEREEPTPEQARFAERLSELVSEYVGPNAGKRLLPAHRDRTKIRLGHASAEGQPVFLDFATESRGTVRALQLLQETYRKLDVGGVLSIDELDASLHTLLALELIGLFSRPETNRAGAQLIATTHDTNLLCSKTLRRDQIWFTQKDQAGATHLFPLTDIRTRNTDNLEKGYLQGRFGAIPFIGSSKSLLEDVC